MRIVGTIDHPILKITVFKMDEKFSIKFENGLLEQTYKIRAGSEINSFEDIQKLIDPKWLSEVMQVLQQMNQAKLDATARFFVGNGEEEFDEIIWMILALGGAYGFPNASIVAPLWVIPK